MKLKWGESCKGPGAMSEAMSKSLRVVLLAPVQPYRGGIAQHSSALRCALDARSRLLTISFAAMYPRWLYPGAAPEEPGAAPEVGVTYLIRPFSPWSWSHAVRLIRAHRPDFVAMAWWTVFWAPAWWFIARALHRAGVRVVFLCHNVYDHETAAWKQGLAQRVLSRGDAFLVHSKEGADRIREMIPGSPVQVFPHPLFTDFPEPSSILPRRARLELLCFGLVRPYKGLDVLLAAMRELGDCDVALTVAGEWWMRNEQLRADLVSCRKVEVIDRYLSREEVANLFARADVVVLPYRSATGSGVIALAYRYGKPVIAACVGGIPDVVTDHVTGWLVPPNDPKALVQAICRCTSDPAPRADVIRRATRHMSWDGLAEALVELGAAPPITAGGSRTEWGR